MNWCWWNYFNIYFLGQIHKCDFSFWINPLEVRRVRSGQLLKVAPNAASEGSAAFRWTPLDETEGCQFDDGENGAEVISSCDDDDEDVAGWDGGSVSRESGGRSVGRHQRLQPEYFQIWLGDANQVVGHCNTRGFGWVLFCFCPVWMKCGLTWQFYFHKREKLDFRRHSAVSFWLMRKTGVRVFHSWHFWSLFCLFVGAKTPCEIQQTHTSPSWRYRGRYYCTTLAISSTLYL